MARALFLIEIDMTTNTADKLYVYGIKFDTREVCESNRLPRLGLPLETRGVGCGQAGGLMGVARQLFRVSRRNPQNARNTILPSATTVSRNTNATGDACAKSTR